MKKTYYVTTPIYYVTDKPHIGHLYTTLAADILARYHRLLGDDVFFLTGTDEHGQKILKKAKETNETAQALADRVVKRYQEAWKHFGVEYDDFIRTTEERHKKVVKYFMAALIESGDIYLSEYEGWYCVPDEMYWTESQINDGKCPDCGRAVEKLKEESYFFRMSAYENQLLDYIDKNPNFIQPQTRKNEVLGFIKQGLKDISVSRTTIPWGIDMPDNPKASKKHCVYVWFDALTNYISALGYLDDKTQFAKYWPEAVHIVGKDILRFHAVYWPTFLMALKLPLPKTIMAHGWLTDANRKISKSLGNAVDPIELANRVGIDGMRYFLFREFTFGQDGEYTEDILYRRINSDLANDFGNSVSRVISMIIKYLGNEAIDVQSTLAKPSSLRDVANQVQKDYGTYLDQFLFNKALESVFTILAEISKTIENSAPWQLAKSSEPKDKESLRDVLVHCHESLRIASTWLIPFMPLSALNALTQLGCNTTSTDKPYRWAESSLWGKGPTSVLVAKGSPLFPRLEIPKANP